MELLRHVKHTVAVTSATIASYARDSTSRCRSCRIFASAGLCGRWAGLAGAQCSLDPWCKQRECVCKHQKGSSKAWKGLQPCTDIGGWVLILDDSPCRASMWSISHIIAVCSYRDVAFKTLSVCQGMVGWTASSAALERVS